MLAALHHSCQQRAMIRPGLSCNQYSLMCLRTNKCTCVHIHEPMYVTLTFRPIASPDKDEECKVLCCFATKLDSSMRTIGQRYFPNHTSVRGERCRLKIIGRNWIPQLPTALGMTVHYLLFAPFSNLSCNACKLAIATSCRRWQSFYMLGNWPWGRHYSLHSCSPSS